jgi:hypothetical protein
MPSTGGSKDNRGGTAVASTFRLTAGMDESVKTRALKLAARVLGGPEKLHERLGVPAAALDGWLSGRAEPPREILLEALDVILDDLDARD